MVFIAALAYAVTGLPWHGGRLMASVVLAGMAVIVASLLAPLTSLTLSPVSPPGAPRPTGQGGGTRIPACVVRPAHGPGGLDLLVSAGALLSLGVAVDEWISSTGSATSLGRGVGMVLVLLVANGVRRLAAAHAGALAAGIPG
ncbi:MAG: hypothetical protein U0Q10_03880 [Dermatophilaceae bacterium]